MNKQLIKAFCKMSIFLSIIIVSNPSFADYWATAYGTTDNNWDARIKKILDKGYILAGNSDFYGNGTGVLIIKLDSNTNVMWVKTITDTEENAHIRICNIVEDGNKNYIIAGTKFRTSGPGSGWVFKLDSTGNLLWSKEYDNSNNNYNLWGLISTYDKCYITAEPVNAAASANWDHVITKIDSTGNVIWTKAWGGTSFDCPRSVQQTIDSGYITVGITNSWGAGDTDILVTKLDSSGNIQWIKTYGGTGGDFGNGIIQTLDSNYIVAGYTDSWGAEGYDILTMKLNSTGNILWAKTFGGISDDEGNSIILTPDSGYIIGGTTASYGRGNTDILFIKLNSTGNIEWAKTFGDTSNESFCSFEKVDSEYIVGGTISSWGAGGQDFLFLKFESDSLTIGSCPYLQSCNPTVNTPSVTVTTPVPTTSSPTTTVTDLPCTIDSPIITVTSICPTAGGTEENNCQCNRARITLSQNSPNPFVGSTTIKYDLPKPTNINISIYNLSGQKIKTLVNENKGAGYHTVKWDGKNESGNKVPTGIYFYNMKAGNFKATQKLTLIK